VLNNASQEVRDSSMADSPPDVVGDPHQRTIATLHDANAGGDIVVGDARPLGCAPQNSHTKAALEPTS
jgi:hypothetical protein